MANLKKIFRLVAKKSKATTTPVKRIDDFDGLWDRQWGVYAPLVVQVIRRKKDTLTFRIVLDASGSTGSGKYTVDLDDGANVWGDLPSTAQLVDLNADPAANLGYLLLNQYWLFEHVNSTELKKIFDGGGGTGGLPKFPKTSSL